MRKPARRKPARKKPARKKPARKKPARRNRKERYVFLFVLKRGNLSEVTITVTSDKSAVRIHVAKMIVSTSFLRGCELFTLYFLLRMNFRMLSVVNRLSDQKPDTRTCKNKRQQSKFNFGLRFSHVNNNTHLHIFA